MKSSESRLSPPDHFLFTCRAWSYLEKEGELRTVWNPCKELTHTREPGAREISNQSSTSQPSLRNNYYHHFPQVGEHKDPQGRDMQVASQSSSGGCLSLGRGRTLSLKHPKWFPYSGELNALDTSSLLSTLGPLYINPCIQHLTIFRLQCLLHLPLPSCSTPQFWSVSYILHPNCTTSFLLALSLPVFPCPDPDPSGDHNQTSSLETQLQLGKWFLLAWYIFFTWILLRSILPWHPLFKRSPARKSIYKAICCKSKIVLAPQCSEEERAWIQPAQPLWHLQTLRGPKGQFFLKLWLTQKIKLKSKCHTFKTVMIFLLIFQSSPPMSFLLKPHSLIYSLHPPPRPMYPSTLPKAFSTSA